ncbi:MAG: FAD-dependent oxidoreductase [Candidatus Xenobiia bacterium LiM19]
MAHLSHDVEKGFDPAQAMAEAHRCLLCYDPPCSRGCPAGTDPGTFIRKLRLRNITGAIRTIKQNNILGGACGILCPTSLLCEKECSATGIDRPIQIGKLQRFLVEYGYQTGFNVFPKPEKKAEKAAVVGSGPAGLSCAAELAKSGYQVTVYEQYAEPGGVLRYGVPAHRFPHSLLDREIDDLRAMGVEIRCSSPIKGKGAAEDLLKNGYNAVFIAPGLWEAVPLNEGGRPVKGVFSSVQFLKALRENKRDEMAPHIKGKRVAVIGGGSVAIDCAESAMRLEARDVSVIYRRSFIEMPSQEDEKVAALQAGIHFLILTRPVGYVTDSEGALKMIELIRTELGDPDKSGRRKPVDIKGSEWTLEVDTVIEAIGQKAETSSPEWYPSVKRNDGNLIIIDGETCETSVKSIYAGGDITRGPALIVQAVWDGKAAARTIVKRLRKEVSV